MRNRDTPLYHYPLSNYIYRHPCNSMLCPARISPNDSLHSRCFWPTQPLYVTAGPSSTLFPLGPNTKFLPFAPPRTRSVPSSCWAGEKSRSLPQVLLHIHRAQRGLLQTANSTIPASLTPAYVLHEVSMIPPASQLPCALSCHRENPAVQLRYLCITTTVIAESQDITWILDRSQN